MKYLNFILFILFVVVFQFNTFAQENDNLIVLVKYKTQPDKGDLAVTAIQQLLEKVKKEPHYVKIVMHTDPADATNILLYEEWSSTEYYNGAHMNTEHLQKFMMDARLFLGGPPEITFWKLTD